MSTTRVRARLKPETGYHIRVMRGGKSVAVRLEDLTEPEIRAWTEQLGPTEARRWLLALVTWIGQNIDREDGN